jgi:zinc transporter
LVAVVNDVAYEFAFDPSEIATLWIQVQPHLLITARTHALRSVDRLRQSVRQGQLFGSTVIMLTELMQDQGRVLEHIVRQASDQVDAIEDQLLSGRLATRRADLSRLRRVLVRLERLLAPEPGALFRFMRHPPAWVNSADLEELQQTSDEMALVLNDLSGLKERIKLLQEEIAAQASEQSNRSLFVLTAMTVLALPINLVAGLFGMNVGGIPLSEDPHGFFFIASGILSTTGLAALFFFARRD